MKIAIFQFAPAQGDVSKNLGRVKQAITEAAKSRSDILLLPELWSCGIAESRETCHADITVDIIEELTALSTKLQISIIGGMPEQDPEDNRIIYNSLFFIKPDGNVVSGRKLHLFKPMGEENLFTEGRSPSLFTLTADDRKIIAGTAICYDLRFPQIFRHLAIHGAEILMLSALWPMTRRKHLELLSRARAVENQCFLAVANGYGLSGKTMLAGASALYAPDGRCLLMAEEAEGLFTVKADLNEVSRARELFITAMPEKLWNPPFGSKIIDRKALIKIAHTRQKNGQKMVFTNGCFDILHAGHVSYLEAARNLGDFLVIGLNSDSSIKNIKGDSRPVNGETERATVLAALASVDYITIFDSETPLELIQSLKPDILVKGADWPENMIAGADTVKKSGGQVVRIPFLHDVSTSEIIAKITNDLA